MQKKEKVSEVENKNLMSYSDLNVIREIAHDHALIQCDSQPDFSVVRFCTSDFRIFFDVYYEMSTF